MNDNWKRFLLAVCGYIFLSAFLCLMICEKLENLRVTKKIETEVTRFIFESFIETCKGNCYESLNEWQKVNRSLWKLDYIAWSLAEDFMVLPEDNREGDLYYGVWTGEYSSGEVYCRMSLNTK